MKKLRYAGVLTAVALALAGCGGEKVGAEQPAATGGKECGTFNLAVSPWVGYEANAAVVAYVAKKDLGCKVVKKNLKEEISWKGRHRRGRRRAGELGPRGLREEVHHRPEGRGRGRVHRGQGDHRLVRAAVDGAGVPGHHRLEEPEQVRRSVQDPGVRRQGPAARRRPVVRDERRGTGEEPGRSTTRSCTAAARPR